MSRDPETRVTKPTTYLSCSVRDIFGISCRFPPVRGTLTEADKRNLSAKDQYKKLMGESPQIPDADDSMVIDEAQESSGTVLTHPGYLTNLSPSNDFLYDWQE